MTYFEPCYGKLSFSTKVNLLYPPLFNRLEVLPSACDKAKLFHSAPFLQGDLGFSQKLNVQGILF